MQRALPSVGSCRQTRSTTCGAQISKRGSQFTEENSTISTIDRPGRSSVISAATDRRGLGEMSKTRPRQPQSPSPVRRHPKMSSVIFHRVLLSLPLSDSLFPDNSGNTD